jgi:2-phospho-L-lactate guanylyltransferase
VQATVHHFDPATRSGNVVTDEGELLPFGGKAFDESPLRMLRPGQRLTVTVTGTGANAHVTGLALGTVGVVPAKPSRP